MLLLTASTQPERDLPRDPRRQRRAGIVWRPYYRGFSTVAYRDGRAIAGISGPWSNRYVLIRWQAPQSGECIETFETLDEAKAAVAGEAASGLREILAQLARPIELPQPGWFARLARWRARWLRRRDPAALARRRRALEETDLRGLHLHAQR
jgi:hypothetical protein